MDSKLRTAFKQTKNRQKWLVSQINFSDKLDTLYYDFTLGELRAGSVNYYWSEVEMRSLDWRIESNRGMQYTQGGGMVPVKPEDQNY